jgi:hypothetical protein
MPTATQVLAAATRLVARSQGYGRQAYISDVAAELGLTVAALAPTLNTLHREGSIVLARADLVAAMDGAKVKASEITHPMLRTATFHFVCV